MTDNENMMLDDFKEAPVFTLTDEDSGEEKDFVLLARAEIDGSHYFALEPIDAREDDECVILKVFEDGEDIVLETIDDDDEFEKVEDYFNDLFFGEADYDNDN